MFPGFHFKTTHTYHISSNKRARPLFNVETLRRGTY